MKSVYVVTGASGFLGSTVVRKLLERGCEVRALRLPRDKAPSVEHEHCKAYEGDVTEIETLKDIFRKSPQDQLIVIHCAAIVYIKSKPNPQVFRVNVGGTENIIQKCLETDAKLIYINSVHAIPEPDGDDPITEVAHFSQAAVTGLYAKSKAEAARLVMEAVKHRGLHAVMIHPSGLIGPGDDGATHMTALMLAAMKGRLPAIVKGGYDFVDVRDVADGILAAAEKGREGECYILSHRLISIKELIDLACRYSHARKVKLILPLSVAMLAAPFCEIYYHLRKQTPLFTRYSLYTLQSKARFSHAKADAELDYHTRSLEETVADTVKWFSDRMQM